MEYLSEIIRQMPDELLIVFGGGVVSLLTQLAKKIRDRFGYEVDPKFIAAVLAIIGGVLYAGVVKVAPKDLMEKIVQFWALAFAGSVALYELYRSLIKKPIQEKSAYFEDFKLDLNNKDILVSLIEAERKSRLLSIDFEPFSLSALNQGKLSEYDLKNHIASLKERIDFEVKNKGDNYISESGI